MGLFLLETQKARLNCFSDINTFKKHNIYKGICINFFSTLSRHTLSFLPTCGFFFQYIYQALTYIVIIA